MTASVGEPSWQRAHDEANDQGHDGYIDPTSGLFVMTQGYLERRGTCCSNICRHCPFSEGEGRPSDP